MANWKDLMSVFNLHMIDHPSTIKQFLKGVGVWSLFILLFQEISNSNRSQIQASSFKITMSISFLESVILFTNLDCCIRVGSHYTYKALFSSVVYYHTVFSSPFIAINKRNTYGYIVFHIKIYSLVYNSTACIC